MTDKQSEQLTFMAVHAHPDDEVFSHGGSFGLLADQGVRTVLVTATMGEEGEIVDPALDEQAREAMFPRLGEVRRKELQASVEALRIQELRLLNYRDSGMAGRPSNRHPESFHMAVFDEAVKKLVALIRELKPQVLVTYDPFGSYGHPDHLQAQRITNVAFEAAAEPRLFPELGLPTWQVSKLYYTVMPRSFFARAIEEARKADVKTPLGSPNIDISTMGTPDELITTRLDVRPYIENKIKAFRAHKTQIAPDNFVFTLPTEQLEQGFGYEHFVLARTAQAPHTGDLEQNFLEYLAEKSLQTK